jgi:hypothetical protein
VVVWPLGKADTGVSLLHLVVGMLGGGLAETPEFWREKGNMNMLRSTPRHAVALHASRPMYVCMYNVGRRGGGTGNVVRSAVTGLRAGEGDCGAFSLTIAPLTETKPAGRNTTMRLVTNRWRACPWR